MYDDYEDYSITYYKKKIESSIEEGKREIWNTRNTTMTMLRAIL